MFVITQSIRSKPREDYLKVKVIAGSKCNCFSIQLIDLPLTKNTLTLGLSWKLFHKPAGCISRSSD